MLSPFITHILIKHFLFINSIASRYSIVVNSRRILAILVIYRCIHYLEYSIHSESQSLCYTLGHFEKEWVFHKKGPWRILELKDLNIAFDQLSFW